MRQVPPRQPVFALRALHWTPQTPQFSGSSASTASQSLLGLRSQSALPGAQFWRRPAASGSGAFSRTKSEGSSGLSAEVVTGTREAQLPHPTKNQTKHDMTSKETLFFTPPLTRKLRHGLGRSSKKWATKFARAFARGAGVGWSA